MEPAQNVGDFVKNPLGRYVVGRTWIAFCTANRVSGFQLWGTSAADDIAELLGAVVTTGSPLAERAPRLIDIRRLGPIEPAVFDLFAGHFANNESGLAQSVSRAAVLHAPGISAALASGFPRAAPMPYPVELFIDPEAAIDWLGGPKTLVDELDGIHAETSDTTPLLRDLRAFLRANLRDATLALAAAHLAMSTRSLQRALSRASATFQDELHRLRIERAAALLAETSHPLARIAHEIGFLSEHHFGAVFKDATGETPRRFRLGRQSKQS
jgi:AraC-like DNA-binding protein